MKCQMYQCKKQAVEQIDVWQLCQTHADEYKKRFKEALEYRDSKRQGSLIKHKEGGNG